MSKKLQTVAFVSLLALGSLWSCNGGASPTEVESADAVAQAAGRAQQAPKLNLSHIECVDGTVEVHFVLLFASDKNPGDLTYTNDGQTYTIPRGPNTGNVWHYTASGLPDGDYDVTAASVTLGNGAVVTLHNPGDYSGTYDCTPSSCVDFAAEPLLCMEPSSLGSPEAECGAFGLVPLGKDDDLSGSTWLAGMDAPLVIVKDGRGPCAQGENAYRTYTNVQAGDVLEKPEGAGDISHVTYCGCAD